MRWQPPPQHQADEQETLVAAAEEAALADAMPAVVLMADETDDDNADWDDDGDTDQMLGARTQMALQVRVCLLNCAEEVCFKNVNAAQLQNQDVNIIDLKL